jgi:hypothetical protein
MAGERRGEPRFIVEGLGVTLDGREHEILDVALTSVRVLRSRHLAVAPEAVRLRFSSEPSYPQLDVACTGHFVREAKHELVYAFTMTDPRWAERLHLYDSFKDFRVPDLED